MQGLYTICDPHFSPLQDPVELARRILQGGAKILQLRMKFEKDLNKIQAAAQAIQSLKADYDFSFIINDHISIAKSIAADGVHVGEDDLPVDQVRDILGPDFMIGYSSHAVSEAEQAIHLGADYVALGAVFPTPTKGPGHPVCGLQELKRLVEASTVPVVAIGGINKDNINSVLETGADAVAMITQIVAADDISQAVIDFRRFFYG